MPTKQRPRNRGFEPAPGLLGEGRSRLLDDLTEGLLSGPIPPVPDGNRSTGLLSQGPRYQDVRRRAGSVGTGSVEGVGWGDVVPGVEMGLALNDLRRLQAEDEAGLDVSNFELGAAAVSVPLSAIGLGAVGKGLSLGAKGLAAAITAGAPANMSKWFSRKAIDAAESVTRSDARTMITTMNPKDFADLAPEVRFGGAKVGGAAYDSRKMENVRHLSKEGVKFDTLPVLVVGPDGRVLKHDGRHRGARMLEADETEMPVVLQFQENLPPEGPPPALLGEGRDTSVPFEPRKSGGAAPNRTDYSLLRHTPARGDSPRVTRLIERMSADGPERRELLKLIDEGKAAGGLDWYNTEGLRGRFVDELGEEAGHDAWKEYMWLVGATSTGSKVPANIRTASHYFQMGPEKRKEMIEELIAQKYVPSKKSGYGHKMQRHHAKNVGSLEAGQWGPEAAATQNPKPRGFAQSLLGGTHNIAADRHFVRALARLMNSPDFLDTKATVSQEFVDAFPKLKKYISQDKRSGDWMFRAKAAVNEGAVKLDEINDYPAVWIEKPNDNEYRALEKFTNTLGEELGMTGPQVQASLWVGAAKHTGVDKESLGTFEEIFQRNLVRQAGERNKSPEELFSSFARRGEALAIPGLLTGGAAGAAGTGLLDEREETRRPPGLL